MNNLYSMDDGKKKPENKSTGYIIAAGAAILVAVAAIFGNKPAGMLTSAEGQVSEKVAEDRNVLRNDIILHRHFRRLQELDEQYNMLITRSASPYELERKNDEIGTEEAALKTTLDSIGRETAKYNSWSDVVLSDSVAASFRKALANRKYLATIRSIIEGKPMDIRKGDKDLLEMQAEMQKKDERIAALEKQVSRNTTPEPAVASDARATTPVDKNLQKENEELSATLKEEQTRNAGLVDITRTLKSDNEKLLAELDRSKKAASGDDAAEQSVRNKVNSLQEEIDDLNAELSFSRVDCNLTRADAKKIISNSRQRKELLADALKTLQSLTRSGNSTIQRRAKDKLAELSEIASMVRD